MQSNNEICERLIGITKAIASRRKARLDELKAEYVRLKNDDFVWYHLLQSFATMGRSAGWHGLIGNKKNYSKVTYEALIVLSPEAREAQVRETCRLAKIRMPDKKADYILGCYDAVHKMGGPLAAKNRLLSLPGRDAKIAFLKSFPGIGEKYSRNIMMDVYHEDFRDSIAIDVRIKNVSEAFGLVFSSYSAHETFYLSVAAGAGLNGWELDRLMYNFQEEFIQES
jgi:hypothetical protein